MELNFNYDYLEEGKKNKNRCWDGYEPVPGKKAYTKGSCRKIKESIYENKKPSDYGLEGYNKPEPLNDDSDKSHHVLAKSGNNVKYIKFGQKGVKGSPKKKGESKAYKKRRESFRARHSKNIKKGKMSAAWWSNHVKW